MSSSVTTVYVSINIYIVGAIIYYVKNDIGGFMNALGYAVLGLLAREPLSGYDLKKRMEQRVGFFWSARHSQIYPELARLDRAGMVAHTVVEQQDRPDKKVYEATPAGLETLKDWVTEPVEPRPARDELVLKAYSLWVAEPEEALALFREQERRHEEKLRQYEELQSWMEREWSGDLKRCDSPQFASYAALRRGILYEREYADWCGWVADRLDKGVGDEHTGRSQQNTAPE
jgi:DNA-binding PadR family transcriptional regulator